jgi:hypothetical protein
MACLTLAAVAAVTGSPRAEISAEVGPNEVGVLVLGIIEGPDPIPQVIWEPIRDVDPGLILNPDGAARGDGRPDIAIDPVTGWPHVVWAFNNGSDFEIAYSCWDGGGWLEPEFLTAEVADQLDPRIFVDAGATYVVWWEQGAKSIWLATRPRGGDWELPEHVNGQSGMRPSVVTWGGTILVASEQDDGQGGREIILSTRLEPGDFNSEFVDSSAEDLSLDVVLHAEQGRLWMDWRHSGSEFAYAEYDGANWSPSATVPWTDDSWLMLEQIRQSIRDLVMSSP